MQAEAVQATQERVASQLPPDLAKIVECVQACHSQVCSTALHIILLQSCMPPSHNVHHMAYSKTAASPTVTQQQGT